MDSRVGLGFDAQDLYPSDGGYAESNGHIPLQPLEPAFEPRPARAIEQTPFYQSRYILNGESQDSGTNGEEEGDLSNARLRPISDDYDYTVTSDYMDTNPEINGRTARDGSYGKYSARGTSMHKKVPLDTLDPTGVAELSRRLSQRTNPEQRMSAGPTMPPITATPRTETSFLASPNKANDITTNFSPMVDMSEDVEKDKMTLTHDPFDENNRFDLERMLQETYAQSDQRGNERRTMGIAFRDLNVTGYGTGYELNQTFGSVLLSPLRILKGIQDLMHRPVKSILQDVEGCVKPGEMLLVLGRPGSGCTSFLKALASYRDGYRSVDGTILYEGLDHRSIDHTLRGDVVYSPEDDVHFPTLTVGQTLRFASATRAPNSKYRVTFGENGSRSDYIDLTREVLATILGLRHTYNTKVGNDMIRGVSGGERKRVSIAETMAARAKIALYDNSSRGLDASTAFEFVTALRIQANISLCTTIASIYQAGENITQLFDKVCLLNQGRLVYFGPVSSAVEHFRSLGFEPQNRQTTADFLVACTDLNGQNINPTFRGKVPRLPDEQAVAFRESKVGRDNSKEVEDYISFMMAHQGKENTARYVELARDERAKYAGKGSRYLISWPMQVRLALKRRYQVAVGDMGTHLTVMLAALFQALIIGSVFYQMPKNTSGFFSRGGVLFFSLLYNSFTAMSEISLGYEQRPIVIRQKRFAMLRPSADALGNTILDFPIRMVSLLIFDIVVYFMTGLEYDARKFFTYFGITCLVTYCMTAFFRMIAASTKSEPLATMFGGVAVLDVALYTGYMIPRKSMKVWWRWLSYCNPVAFGFEILLSNEYRDSQFDCSTLVPTGPGYEDVSLANQVCPVAGSRPGSASVDAEHYLDLTYGFKWEHTVRNAMIVLGFWGFFIIMYLYASENQVDPAASAGAMLYNRATVSEDKVKAAQVRDEEKGADEEALAPLSTEPVGDVSGGVSSGIKVSESVFSWNNITYDVMIKGKPRRLLNYVSGYVAPGKMTALMGESGAGKTTLLNVLAQRTDTGVVRGDFLVNGMSLPRSFQSDTGYCQQQDVHLAQHTVREALQFSAMLRQSRETPKKERLAYVETVIKLLEMESFAEAMVGEVGEGLNVEQRKRLTIGVELAAKPSLLLFLDEPTSGLDAQAAWSVVRFLKKLANEGQAILCTIHQPSGELFNQFDRLLLLQKGGKTVYFGDLGENSMQLINYFEKRSGIPCGENANPAEYILDVIGAGATATTDKDWHQLFLESELYTQLRQDLTQLNQRKAQPSDAQNNLQANREYAQPFMVQVVEVTKRAFISYWRNPLYLITKMILNVVSGLVVGSSFWAQGKEQSYIALQNRLFACFLALVASTSLSQHLQPEFIRFRGLFEVREKPSKMYSWPVMVLGALLVEIPWNFLGGTIYWLPWYYFIQFPSESQRSAYSWGLYMLFQLYYCTFGQAMAAISPNAMIASILFSTFFSFVVVFCGVVQPPDQLPTFWGSWMFYLSPFTWIMEGMLGDAIGGVAVHCELDEMQQINPPEGQDCSWINRFAAPRDRPELGGRNGYWVSGPQGECMYCLYRYGDDYLDTVKMHADHRYADLGIVVAYIAFNTALLFGLFWLFRIYKLGKGRRKNKGDMMASAPETEGPVPPGTMQVEAPTMGYQVPHVIGYELDNLINHQSSQAVPQTPPPHVHPPLDASPRRDISDSTTNLMADQVKIDDYDLVDSPWAGTRAHPLDTSKSSPEMFMSPIMPSNDFLNPASALNVSNDAAYARNAAGSTVRSSRVDPRVARESTNRFMSGMSYYYDESP